MKWKTQLLLPPKNAKSDASLQEYLEMLEAQTGKRDKRLDAAEIPRELLHLWGIFWTTYEGKPITFAEMRAREDLTGESLTPWEAETLRMMGMVAVKEAQSV